MPITRHTIAAAAALALTLGIAACSSGASKNADTSQSGGQVNIGIASPTAMTWAPELVAQQQGYLKRDLAKANSTYKVTDFSGGAPLFAAIAAGNVDLALVPTTTVASLNAKSRGLSCVMMVARGDSDVIVGAAKYQKSRGTDITKYNGAKWGYSAAGSNGEQLDQIVAANAGLNWSNQQGVALGSATASEPALATGRIDLFTADPVTAENAVKKGTGYIILNSNDPTNNQTPYPDTGDCLAGRTGFLQQHPDQVQQVVNAIYQGLLDVQKNMGNPAHVVALFPPLPDGAQLDTAEWALVAPAMKGLTGVPTSATRSDTQAMASRTAGAKLPDAVLDESFTTKYINSARSAAGQ